MLPQQLCSLCIICLPTQIECQTVSWRCAAGYPSNTVSNSCLSDAQIMHTAAMGRTQKEDGEEGIDPEDIFHGMVFFLAALHLLSAPLMIPLVCCHIKSFRRASRGGEAIARRRKEARQAGSASGGMARRWSRGSSRVRHRGVPARERVPARCHASGAAVDVCSDALAWA